jgi:hypothetical protein
VFFSIFIVFEALKPRQGGILWATLMLDFVRAKQFQTLAVTINQLCGPRLREGCYVGGALKLTRFSGCVTG